MKEYYRGREIKTNTEGHWVFSDTNTLVKNDINCYCGDCGKLPTQEGHDQCISNLIGCMNACCGHGSTNKAYVQFLDGKCIRGEDAITIQNILKRHIEE